MQNIFNPLLIQPIVNVLMVFYKLFEGLHFPGPLGFAIIALTLVIRAILYPIMTAQMKSARKMQKLKPHLDELSKKHKNDKQALQQAQLALYKEHGVNPAAGCLPLILQLPVLLSLYNVFSHVLSNDAKVAAYINSFVYAPWLKISHLDLSFFGFNLITKPSAWQTAGWWLLSIPIITGLLQYFQTKLMMAQTPPPTLPVKAPEKKSGKDEGKDKKDEDMAMEMQKQMAIISPIMFAFFAYQFPMGLALYWNVFGIFGIIQQRIINKNVDKGV